MVIEKTVRCAHPGGFHDMVYSDWGQASWGQAGARRTVVCVHGLTRSGRDFDRLALVLADSGYRVLAPDIVGRGRSGRLGPFGNYEIPQYINDLTCMLAAESVADIDWIGTSMGGLIGMSIAAMDGHPIRRMLINDVGPFVPKEALRRIGEYVGIMWQFDTFEAALDHVKKAYAPFGLTSEEDWRYLAELSLRQDDAGQWVNAYDGRIAEPFRSADIGDVDLWSLWDHLSLPIMVLRGAESDLLTADVAQAMIRRGPKAQLLEVAGCGHAPALMDAGQIGIVRDWLQSGEEGEIA